VTLAACYRAIEEKKKERTNVSSKEKPRNLASMTENASFLAGQMPTHALRNLLPSILTENTKRDERMPAEAPLQCSMETMEVGIIQWTGCAKSGKMQAVAISRSVLPTEMLLRILLACLVSISQRLGHGFGFNIPWQAYRPSGRLPSTCLHRIL
jgi:hypothetical protein